MNWRKLFTPRILTRGYDYYMGDAVKSMDVKDDIIKAEVRGEQDYKVEISLSDGEVRHMKCTCSYAKGGNNCKHMVAVLHKWSENDEEEDVFLDSSDDVISKRETILNHYIWQFDCIVDLYSDRYGYISYDEEDDFVRNMKIFVRCDLYDLIHDGKYLIAFKVIFHMFDILENVDISDYSIIVDIKKQLYDLSINALSKLDQSEKDKIFDWIISSTKDTMYTYLNDHRERIIIKGFKEQRYTQKKLDFIELMIEKSMANNIAEQITEKWFLRYIGEMNKQKASNKQKKEICKKFWDLSFVRQYYIELCVTEKDYDQALDALDQSILKDHQDANLLAVHNIRKKEIYQLQGNHEAYVDQLWKLILEFCRGDLSIYDELKSQYTKEEWIKKREIIFERTPDESDIFYKEEKLYDRLMAYVEDTSGLNVLMHYEDILAKLYPQRLLAKYKKELNRMALTVMDTKGYSELVEILKNMQKIEGGKVIVKQIVVQWEKDYKRRPAMISKLKNFKKTWEE